MTLEGKGFFTYLLPQCENGDPAAILAAAQAAGLSHVIVKVADGPRAFGIDSAGNDFTAKVVYKLRNAGIAIWGWHYVYGNDPSGEAKIAVLRAQALGLDGYVVDAEQEYKQPGKDKAARQFMSTLRSALDLPLILSAYRFPEYHPEFPWAAFLEFCDYHMPQVYWEQAHNAGGQLRESKRQCDALPNARLYLATGAAYGTADGWFASPADVTDFLNTTKALGIPAVNFFSWDYCRGNLPATWKAVADFAWSVPPQTIPGPETPPVVVTPPTDTQPATETLPSTPETPTTPVDTTPAQPPVAPVDSTPETPVAPVDTTPAETPTTTPVTPPAPPKPIPPDAFTASFIATLNSLQAGQVAAFFNTDAVNVRAGQLLRGAASIQLDFAALFTSLPAGVKFTLQNFVTGDDVRYLAFLAGARLGKASLVLQNGKISLGYVFIE
jgi:hypothetical protein